jgi:hypothetical protein
MTRATDYDVKCMLCGAEVGQILAGKFTQHPGCTAEMPRKAGLLRCCHCGGSLYLDPIDVYAAGIDRAQLRKAFASSAA